MKRVLHLITTLERGGAENQLMVLVTEQIQADLEVGVLGLKGTLELKGELTKVGAKVFEKVTNYPFLFQIFLTRKLIKRFSPDIVHAHLPRAELLALFSTSRIPFIVSRHNSEAFFPKAPKTISNYLSRLVLKKTVGGIAISKAVLNYMESRGELPLKHNFEVIYYGAKTRDLHNSPKTSKFSKNLLLEGKFIVGTIGRLAFQKDYPTLLKAFSMFVKLKPNTLLLVVGSGPAEKKIKTFAEAIGLGDKVIWIGRTSEIEQFLSVLDVFILTSIYEGFGLVLLEAIQAGIPIIAANNSAMPEVLGSGYLGFAETGNVDQFTSLLVQSTNEDFRTKLIQSASSRLDLFDSKKMYSEVKRKYEASISRNSK